MSTNQKVVGIPPLIGFRNGELKLRLQRLAERERRSLTNLANLLLTEAVEQQEKEHGLPPVQDDPNYEQYFEAS